MTLRILDLFSGIGGFSLGAQLVGGFETVQFVERDPFCQRILHKHWPNVPIHDDICTFQPQPRSADVVVGGFPCQDISYAGKGAGLAGERSGLFYELLRIVRLVEPQYVVLENVAAILNRGMDDVLGALAETGYNCEWACIPAAAVGACHQRDRWWCVAYANHAGVEASRPKQQTAGTEQHRELDAKRAAAGFAANTTSKQRNELRSDGPSREDKSKPGNSDGAFAHSMRQRLEGPNELAGSRSQWPAAPFRLSPDWGGYVSQPVLCRGDDGLSGRVDRLRALGNAVVPQVAAIPLTRVRDLAGV